MASLSFVEYFIIYFLPDPSGRSERISYLQYLATASKLLKQSKLLVFRSPFQQAGNLSQNILHSSIIQHPSGHLIPFKKQRHPVMNRLHGSICGCGKDYKTVAILIPAALPYKRYFSPSWHSTHKMTPREQPPACAGHCPETVAFPSQTRCGH